MELGLGFNSAALFVSLPHSALCLTGLFTSVIHILNLRETCVPVFAGGYIILRILKFFKVYKRQNKTPPFFYLFNDENNSYITAYGVNKCSAEYIFDLQCLI